MHSIQAVLSKAAVVSLVAFYFFLPWTLAGAHVALGCMLVAWLLEARWRKRWQVAAGNAMTPALLVLYLLLIVGAIYTTAPWADVMDHWLKYDRLLLMVVALSLLSEPRVREQCWTAFTATMVLTLATCYLNIWWDLPWSKAVSQGWGADYSVFKDYITQSAMMALLAARALYLALGAEQRWKRWCWGWIVLATFVCNTQLSWGRTGHISTAVVAIVLVMGLTPPRRWAAALAAVGLALVIAVWLSPAIRILSVEALHDVRQAPDIATSTGQRLYMWTRSLELFAQHPVLGWGTGAYHGEFCRLASSATWCAAGSFHPHNQFLFFMVEYGLVGLVCFLGLFVAAVWQAWQLERRDRAVALAFIAVVCVGNMTHSGFWLSNESLAYGFGLVLVLSAPRRLTQLSRSAVT